MTKIAQINLKGGTGFNRHISCTVEKEFDKPNEETMKHIRSMWGDKFKEKWFDVTGDGFDKNWLYVAGI